MTKNEQIHEVLMNLNRDRITVSEAQQQMAYIQSLNCLLFDFWVHVRGGLCDTPIAEIEQGVAEFLATYNR